MPAVVLLAACQSAPQAEFLDDLIVATRTPLPEPTPGVLQTEIVDAAASAGLAGASFIGVPVEVWINLAISLVIVFGGYALGFWLLRWVYRKVASRLPPGVILEEAGNLSLYARWLIFIAALYIATARLSILGPSLRRALLDVYFLCAVVLLAIVVWQLIDLTARAFQRRADPTRLTELRPLILLVTRLGHIAVVVVAVTVILSHFGISIAALTAVVGLGGLALSLAARDTIADAIAGMLILLDRPFRVGDRIEIETINTWGDVVDIGLRTTRIRTRDNRLIIVPNSIIGSNQIINYSYPDPRYRIQSRVALAYGTDIEWARQIMVEAVRQVDGVLTELGVEALYEEMGDSAMIFLVRWWIESFVDTRRMFDKVHTALQGALDANGIMAPFPTQTVILQSSPERGSEQSPA